MKRRKVKFLDYLLAIVASVVMVGFLVLIFMPAKPQPPHKIVEVAVEHNLAPPEKPEGHTENHSEYAEGDAIVHVAPEARLEPANKQPRITLVIDDMGLDVRGSERAVDLPAAVTLSYMPYATRLKEQTRAAREAGHELLLHMPMEPVGHQDPGPNALLTGLDKDEIRHRVQDALASFVGFDGINNHMGSKFTADRTGMDVVMEELKARNLFFLDSRTSAKTVGRDAAQNAGVSFISRDVFLDDDISPRAIALQLSRTEDIARRQGYAVAIGHPHEATLAAIEEWIGDVEGRGIVLVPLHDLLHQQ